MIITNIEYKLDNDTYVPSVHFSGYYSIELLHDLAYTFEEAGNTNEEVIKLTNATFGELFVIALREWRDKNDQTNN
jgi:hypothetical protein